MREVGWGSGYAMVDLFVSEIELICPSWGDFCSEN